LFAFGFGLTYADNGDLAALPEASGVTGNEGATGVFFARGDAGPGMALRLEQAAGQGLTVTRVPDALPDDRLKITGVDHLVQEDGRRLAWSGKGEAVAALQSHTALDLQRESNGDLMLLTTLRVDAAPEVRRGCRSVAAWAARHASPSGRRWRRFHKASGSALACR
jgi:beta-glucosidase